MKISNYKIVKIEKWDSKDIIEWLSLELKLSSSNIKEDKWIEGEVHGQDILDNIIDEYVLK
jgi:hypothetical protein